MPYTRREVKFLFSNDSPLSPAQKDKMKSELHANPALGHQKKGSVAMKRSRETFSYDWRQREGLKQNQRSS